MGETFTKKTVKPDWRTLKRSRVNAEDAPSVGGRAPYLKRFPQMHHFSILSANIPSSFFTGLQKLVHLEEKMHLAETVLRKNSEGAGLFQLCRSWSWCANRHYTAGIDQRTRSHSGGGGASCRVKGALGIS